LLTLSDKVDEITSVRKKSFIPNIIPKNINYLYVYIGIPIICCIILTITKPKIVMTETKDKSTFFIDRKLSYSKLFFIIIFVIMVEIIIYFLLNVKIKS
jgi:hypothetical protein